MTGIQNFPALHIDDIGCIFLVCLCRARQHKGRKCQKNSCGSRNGLRRQQMAPNLFERYSKHVTSFWGSLVVGRSFAISGDF